MQIGVGAIGLGIGGRAASSGVTISGVSLSGSTLSLTLSTAADVDWEISANLDGSSPVLTGSFSAGAGTTDEPVDISSLAVGDWYLRLTATAGASSDSAGPVGFHVTPRVTIGTITPSMSGASVAWSTTGGDGTAYWLVSANATETDAAIKAGTSVAVSASGAQAEIAVSGLSASTGYYIHILHTDASPADSAAVHGGFTTTSAYAANAVKFDGAESLANLSAPTATGSRYALVCVSFFIESTYPSTNYLLALRTSTGGDRIMVYLSTTNRLRFAAYDSAGTTIANLVTSNNKLAVDTWYTALFALDTTQATNATRLRAYLRPSGGAWSDLTTGAGTFTTTLDGVIGDCVQWRINNAPSSPVYYSDVYARIDTTLDISNATERDKFLPAVDKGTTGNIPTGTAPYVYLSGSTGTWHQNKGTGGGGTMTGTLSTAPSAPV